MARRSPRSERLRWRDYRTVSGLSAARHLRGEIYEVRVEGRDVAIRILFAHAGKERRILLALEGFAKKTQKRLSR